MTTLANGPLAEVARLLALRSELDVALDAAIITARASGATFTQLAVALGGITKQAARERHGTALRRLAGRT